MARKSRFKHAKWWLLIALGVATMACVLVLWTAAGMATAGRAEELKPLVTLERDGYFLGLYPAHTLASTEVEGERYTRAMFRGFEVLNRYISGNNDQKKRVPMTAPVLQQVTGNSGEFIISFVLPWELTRTESEPKPSDQRVFLQRRPTLLVAVRPFSGYATSEYAAEQIAILKDLLERDGYLKSGTPAVAQFDPPWTPPFMRYNEVWWPLDSSVFEVLKPDEVATINEVLKRQEDSKQP